MRIIKKIIKRRRDGVVQGYWVKEKTSPLYVKELELIFEEWLDPRLLQGDRIGDVLILVSRMSDGTYWVREVCQERLQEDGVDVNLLFKTKREALAAARHLVKFWMKKPLPRQLLDRAEVANFPLTYSGVGSPEESFGEDWEEYL